MKRVILLGALTLAAISLNLRPAAADFRGSGPWCAVYSLGFGDDVWDCSYNSVQACQPNVIAGNRGFCNHNPGWYAPNSSVEPRRRTARRHAQRG
jgi:hypothetical protein